MTSHVCKFGGTSLADATQLAKVRAIVEADPRRRYLVPSAPGRRQRDDAKITDLLYLCYEHARQGLPFGEIFDQIATRYRQIVSSLNISIAIDRELRVIQNGINERCRLPEGPHYAASRGEYLLGKILAQWLDVAFIDPTSLIFFDQQGRLDESRTYRTIAKLLAKCERAVIPGFYGTAVDGTIQTFSRGGSDISGAVVARGVGAALYENWTDVSGLLMADPAIIPNPKTIDVISYHELRELAYMGATVLHDEAIFPVRGTGVADDSIPIHILNTNQPEESGTRIVSEAGPPTHSNMITGIAGRKDFTVIALEKTLMNTEVGFGRRALSVLERHQISFEHLPSGIDTMSLVIEEAQLCSKRDQVIQDLKRECNPDSIMTYPDMALIATVGRGMTHTPGMAARLFAAMANSGVNVRMIDQGSSELNIIVGVEATDFEQAVRAIYQTFVESKE